MDIVKNSTIYYANLNKLRAKMLIICCNIINISPSITYYYIHYDSSLETLPEPEI